jgi:hypothetical protein
MAKKLGLISPTQLWGKPLKSVAPQKAPEEKVTGKMTYDEDVTEDEIDVDAELANADVEEDEELHAVEATTDADVSDEVEDGNPDEEEAEDDEPDYDAEEGDDVSAESEDAVEDGEVVTAVVDNEEEGDVEVPATTGKSSMSDKMSLSDHVRAEITRRQKAGESPIRGKDIVETLAKRKLKVSPAQVSQLLKKAGLGGQSRGKKAAAPAAAAAAGAEKIRAAGMRAKKGVEPATPTVKAAAKARPTGNGFKVPMEQLKAAEAFVESCGGSFQSAERILTAAAQLSQTFGG